MSNRLEALRVFCAAADAANFRDAAVRLSVSPQVVTRAVRELEEELGEPLFHRSTRGVQLTDFGRQLAQRARTAVGGVDALFHRTDRRALSQHAGTVRVTAPNVFGRRLIPQALAPDAGRAPGPGARPAPVGEACRRGRRADRHRRARRARSATRASWRARPAGCGCTWWRRRRSSRAPACRRPRGARPAAAHRADRPTSGRPWSWFFSKGRQVPVVVAGLRHRRRRCGMRRGAGGLGFGQLVGPLAEPLLQSGALVAVLEAEAPEPWPIHVYRSQRAPVPARVRLVYDELVRVLR
jgi:DNA-binding transcriptional LysR family regulator